ncbi:ATP phosphoribosyltransferase [Myroides indicus]|uniref:ATP phosphoribosyltransferase n=1 Tax=Myroides indicus TaxID=1323422 RepID=A0A4R7EYK6_9FLAO|nr:ATP phosphoribosyltransferase [Myroides indicus]TDS56913.1 ATP phosphoribosyltransferase [Myroides indicus]
MSKLKIAIQKKGRLSEKTLLLLQECNIRYPNGGDILKSESSNFPIELLFLRDDDISKYVAANLADIGIIGENVYREAKQEVDLIEYLGFASCRLSLAIPRHFEYKGLSFFQNKKIATSYPNILENFLYKRGITASIEFISGSVEIAPSIGLADAICDIVSSGSTLMANGLKEVEKIIDSQAVLIANPRLSIKKKKTLDELTFRIKAVLKAKENKYILLNAPNDKIKDIIKILPGMKSPTLLPLANKNWSSLHSVIQEDQFWKIIDELKQAGAEGILVAPIEKMIF